MSHDHKLKLRTLIMIFTMVACINVGEILLKRGMTHIGAVKLTPEGLLHAFRMTLENPTIWFGMLCLAGFMASYMTALSWADYSYVMPAGAFGYAGVTLLAVIFLGEQVSVRRWFGVILICVGVILVGLTKPRTTEAAL
jgi:drug/metabolite transporter (DMT)-like permease